MASITNLHSPISNPGDNERELTVPVVLQASPAATPTSGVLAASAPVCVNSDPRFGFSIDQPSHRDNVISCHDENPSRVCAIDTDIHPSQKHVRSDRRVPVQLSAVVIMPARDKIAAKVIDMSRSGLGLELSAEVPVGARIPVEFISGTVFGEVRHCSAISLVYRAGMRIDEFVIRKRNESEPSLFAIRARTDTLRGRAKRLARIYCSFVGHEYEWWQVPWGHSVLRCARCCRDLDASTQ
jgi:hypothetical protein